MAPASPHLDEHLPASRAILPRLTRLEVWHWRWLCLLLALWVACGQDKPSPPPPQATAPRVRPRLEEAAPPPAPPMAALPVQLDLAMKLGAYHDRTPTLRTRLQLDRSLYAPGETVWIRTLELKTKDFSPSPGELPVLYQLLSPAGGVLLEKRVRQVEGQASNDLELPVKLAPGVYRIRAIPPGGVPIEETIFVRPEGAHFTFSLEYARSGYKAGDEVSATVRVHRKSGKPVRGKIMPALVKVGSEVVSKPKTMTDASGTAVLRFRLPTNLPAGLGQVTVLVEDEDQYQTVTRALPLAREGLQLRFFPEGGELVAGLTSRVYFSASDAEGRPAEIEGRVVDDRGLAVARFKTAHRGMGRFAFTPLPGRTYGADITSPPDAGPRVTLPDVQPKGCVLRVYDDPFSVLPELRVGVQCSREQDLVLSAWLREREWASASTHVAAKTQTTVYLRPSEPELAHAQGPVRLTLFSSHLVPLAERLVYRGWHQGLQLTVTPDRPFYSPRDQVNLTIETRDPEGEPIPASLAIGVVDLGQLKDAPSFPPQLLSQLLLQPELPEPVEDADYYFLEAPPPGGYEPAAALDLLLGTRGHRRFEWRRVLGGPRAAAAEASPAPEATPLAEKTSKKKRKDASETPEEAEKSSSTEKRSSTESRLAAKALEQAVASAAPVATMEQLYQVTFPAEEEATEDEPRSGVRRETNVLPGVADSSATAQASSPAPGQPAPSPDSSPSPASGQTESGTTGPTPAASPAPASSAEVAQSPAPDAPSESSSPGSQGSLQNTPSLSGSTQTDSASSGEEEDDEASSTRSRKSKKGSTVWAKVLEPEGHSRKDFPQKVKATVEKNQKDVLSCFEAELKTNPTLRETIYLELTISESGELESGHIQHTGVWEESFDRCLLDRMERWKFAHNDVEFHQVRIPVQLGWDQMHQEGIASRPAPQGSRLSPLEERWARVRVFPAPAYGQTLEGPRTDFRKTVYWNPAVTTGPDGRAVVTFYLSDAISRFRVSVEGLGAGFPGQSSLNLESRLPFSLELSLPERVTQGDRIDLPLTLKSESTQPLTIALTQQLPDLLTLAGQPLPGVLTLEPGGRRGFMMPLTVTGGGGEGELRFTATANALQEAFISTLRVLPGGYPRETTVSGVLKESSTRELLVTAPLPGTVHTRVVIYPSSLASVTGGLEALARQPVASFEQSLSTTWPHSLVLRLLRQSLASNAARLGSARDALARGYRRIPGFESPSRGFTAYPGGPGDEDLTAYGLWLLTELKAVFGAVDESLLTRSATWLMGRRDGQGGFRRRDPVDPSRDIQADATSQALYLLALSAAGVKGLDLELDALTVTLKRSRDPYLISLSVQALLAAGRIEQAISLGKRLADAQYPSGCWVGSARSLTGSGGSSLTIEATALAIQALVQLGGYPDTIQDGIRWLLKSRRGDGSFGSSQATLQALRALALAAGGGELLSKASSEKASGKGESTAVGEKKTVKKDEKRAETGKSSTEKDGKAKNKDEKASEELLARRLPSEGYIRVRVNAKDAIQQIIPARADTPVVLEDFGRLLRSGRNYVDLKYVGPSSVQYSAQASWATTDSPQEGRSPLQVSTALSAPEIRLGTPVTLTVSVRNVENVPVTSPMVRVGLPGGLQPSPGMAARLRSQRHADGVDLDGLEVRLFWRSLKPGESRTVSLELVAKVPGHYTGPATGAWLWYTPEKPAWAPPLQVRILP